jgi:hypothetical protein
MRKALPNEHGIFELGLLPLGFKKYSPANDAVLALDRLACSPEESPYYAPECAEKHGIQDGEYVIGFEMAFRDAILQVEFYKKTRPS